MMAIWFILCTAWYALRACAEPTPEGVAFLVLFGALAIRQITMDAVREARR